MISLIKLVKCWTVRKGSYYVVYLCRLNGQRVSVMDAEPNRGLTVIPATAFSGVQLVNQDCQKQVVV